MFMWWVLSQPDARVALRVVDDDVGVGARLDDALAAVEAEHPRRRGRAQLDPALEGDLARDDALVEQVQAVLDRADPVGDLGEVADAELLLLLHAERAVVGADDAEVAGAQVAPQLVLVALRPGPQRRAAHPLRALEARCAELLLEARGRGTAGRSRRRRCSPRRAPPRAWRPPAWRSCGRRRAGAPVSRASMIARWVASSSVSHGRVEPVVDRVGLAAGQRLGDEDVDGDAVLGVHHDRASRSRAPAASPAGSGRRRSRRRRGRP